MKLNKKQFKKWIDALDNGKYEQTKGTLQNGDGYCCLGVACKVLIPEKKLELNTNGFIIGMMPDSQKSPQWLQKINMDFNDRIGGTQLTELNDDKNFTFSEIATLLELVYIHKAFSQPNKTTQP